ncbi:lung adenoma susceptibility protein 2 [Stegastes partitus]|uniref:Lung adenoma susceptibility protein 2 n=1 Tax=Stegastes partitus TaxID=144197 RepID=A0A9Y4TUE4_9TELE|nr:PREDICTED: lung adenoma susceptibility protein 2 [Stegastes partitus]
MRRAGHGLNRKEVKMMEFMLDDFLSPESTVTSLLSSSGHLRSSLRPPEHNTTVRYRDKNYDSASAALDAYISDFERSRHGSEALTGTLVLQPKLPSTPRRARLGMLRNKDVLRERLTDQELDFLNLPVSSLRHRSNRDRVSMTTDELLSILISADLSPTNTDELLLRPPAAPDSAAGGGVAEALTGEEMEDHGSRDSSSVQKQPGPVEALKQMLFRLQSVESELQRRQQQQQQASAAPELPEGLKTPEKQRPDVELQGFPGSPSLHRALHHLNRLKLLVEEPTENPRMKEEEEEKDEDEGRYSSSSADGLISSQSKPS